MEKEKIIKEINREMKSLMDNFKAEERPILDKWLERIEKEIPFAAETSLGDLSISQLKKIKVELKHLKKELEHGKNKS